MIYECKKHISVANLNGTFCLERGVSFTYSANYLQQTGSTYRVRKTKDQEYMSTVHYSMFGFSAQYSASRSGIMALSS